MTSRPPFDVTAFDVTTFEGDPQALEEMLWTWPVFLSQLEYYADRFNLHEELELAKACGVGCCRGAFSRAIGRGVQLENERRARAH